MNPNPVRQSHRPRRRRVGKCPAAARALAFVTLNECRKGSRLRTCATYYDEHVPESSIEILGHSVGGITYRHYAHRAPLAFKAIMTLPLPKVLKHPRLLFVGLEVRLRFNTGKSAELSESLVRARSSPKKFGIIQVLVPVKLGLGDP